MLAVALLVLIGAALTAPAAMATPSHRIYAQENRPTGEQPSPGVGFSRPAEAKDWSFNWVARPLVAIVILLLAALAVGFAVKWIGVGHRTS
jgi:hypothetical protein